MAGLRRRRSATAFACELAADGSLRVPGESVTDPVVYTRALIAAAEDLGAELRTRGAWRRCAEAAMASSSRMRAAMAYARA